MRRPLVGRWVVAGIRLRTMQFAHWRSVLEVPVSIRTWSRRAAEGVAAGRGLNGLDPARPTHDITITFEPGALLRRRPR